MAFVTRLGLRGVYLDAPHEGVVRRLEKRAGKLVQRRTGKYGLVAVAKEKRRTT